MPKSLPQPGHLAGTIAHVTGSIGGRVAVQLAIRESLKFIPWVGRVPGVKWELRATAL